MPIPVVAAVNGFALGGGREIALCMDSEDAREGAEAFIEKRKAAFKKRLV